MEPSARTGRCRTTISRFNIRRYAASTDGTKAGACVTMKIWSKGPNQATDETAVSNGSDVNRRMRGTDGSAPISVGCKRVDGSGG